MKKLCFGCMRMKTESPTCEHCGYDETKENLSHQLPVGTMLQGQYLIGRVLGQGGFGITYMGWDQHLSIPVAIKEYFPGGVVQRHTQLSTKVSCVNGETPELFAKHRDRFLKEARTLAQLSDIPEIVQIHSFFPENDTAYIVMEYVQGITLKAHLRQLGRPMTETEVLDIMEPVLKALQKVHDHGLIHRDISPDNIMLPVGGGVKLIDFGTVRYMDDSGKSKSTEAVLKPGFAPMEQYNTRGNLGTWTDVYALCATFHYLLTGKVPEESVARLEGDGTLPLLRNRQELSSRLIRILEKGMAVRIPDRIQSVDTLYQLLYREQTLPETEPQTKACPPKKSRKRLPVFALLAVLLLAAGIFLIRPRREGTVIPETTQPSAATQEAPAPNDIAVGMSEIEIRYNEAMALAQEGQYAQAALAFGKLGSYRDALQQSFAMWDKVAYRETVSADYEHFLAIKEDGSVITCCEEYQNQCNVQDWTGIIAVSASGHHAVGLRADGTVVATGNNDYGQCDIEHWQNIVAISANDRHTVGLKADGTVVAVGDPGTDKPHPANRHRTDVDGWTDIIAISTNEHQTMGLKLDGTVITSGSSNWGQEELADWNHICAIDAAYYNAVALRSDGTAVSTTKWNDWQQCNVQDWADLIGISGGFKHTVGLKKDGTVVATGSNMTLRGEYCGQCDVSGWQDIVFVTAGEFVTLGLRSDGTLLQAGEPWYNYHNGVTQWSGIQLPSQ